MPNYPTESQIIARIRERFPTRADLVGLGIGDDCEWLKRCYPLVTTDCFVEGVHFDLRYMTLTDAAYRAMTANLSDIAAMGGEAGAFLLSLGLVPKRFVLSQLDLFMDGILECIHDHAATECFLAGGDVVRSPNSLFFNICMLGSVSEGAPLTRSAAAPGDLLVVFGALGQAALGFGLLEKGVKEERFSPFYDAFLRPKAQLKLGKRLRELAHAAMDLSDGLLQDCPKLLAQSRIGAEIYVDALELSELEREAAEILKLRPLDLVLQGGEDFSLLAAIAPDRLESAQVIAKELGVAMQIVGKCVEAPGLNCYNATREYVVQSCGFEHFE
ncbi:MAG: thiamine-phosphate kinase [Bradymonadia bacterium]|jgi:thiamine-monophosphate kinase